MSGLAQSFRLGGAGRNSFMTLLLLRLASSAAGESAKTNKSSRIKIITKNNKEKGERKREGGQSSLLSAIPFHELASAKKKTKVLKKQPPTARLDSIHYCGATRLN